MKSEKNHNFILLIFAKICKWISLKNAYYISVLMFLLYDLIFDVFRLKTLDTEFYFMVLMFYLNKNLFYMAFFIFYCVEICNLYA